jgi:hypothetical protein
MLEMDDYRTRRFISIAVIIVIMAVAIFGLIFVANLLFFSNGSSPFVKINTHESDLLSTTANREVRANVRGPIVADENFRSYQIDITPSTRTFTVYNGYEDQVSSNESLYNNTPSYTQFVYALDHARLMNANELTGSANNTAGVCATGFLYEFTILNDGKQIKQLWTTSCGNAGGSLGVNFNPVLQLFIVQIPDAQTKITAIWQ